MGSSFGTRSVGDETSSGRNRVFRRMIHGISFQPRRDFEYDTNHE